MSATIGIDLGTIYSCVATLKNGSVEVIPNDDDGRNIIPSCVSFTRNKRLVGAAAKNQMASNPSNTITSEFLIIV